MTILKDKIVTVRKPQRCWGCGYRFQPGSRARYLAASDNGEMQSSYWCKPCSMYYTHCEIGNEGIAQFDFRGDPDYLAFQEELGVEDWAF